MKTLKRKILENIETITKLRDIQEGKVNTENKGNNEQYNIGVYNGLEIALSVLEERKPQLFIMPELETKQENKPKGRTIHSGIIRRS